MLVFQYFFPGRAKGFTDLSRSLLTRHIGRKFRLSVHRKNEERKKQNITTLPISINLTRFADPSPFHEVPECVVSLPVSAYMASEVSSLQCLQTRVSAILLPKSWIYSSDHSTA